MKESIEMEQIMQAMRDIIINIEWRRGIVVSYDDHYIGILIAIINNIFLWNFHDNDSSSMGFR